MESVRTMRSMKQSKIENAKLGDREITSGIVVTCTKHKIRMISGLDQTLYVMHCVVPDGLNLPEDHILEDWFFCDTTPIEKVIEIYEDYIKDAEYLANLPIR